VKLHDGYVDVSCNPEGEPGTTFSLELPIFRKTSHILSPLGSPLSTDSYDNRDNFICTGLPGSVSSVSEVDEDEEDDEEDNDDYMIHFSSNAHGDLHMDLDDQIDEKLVLAKLVSEKEQRLAKHEKEQLKNQQHELLKVDTTLPVLSVMLNANHSLTRSISAESHRAVEEGPLYGCRVLLIDDSKLILRVTSKTLESLGVVCDTALDGKIGIEKIAEVCHHAINVKTEDVNTTPTMAWNNDYYDLVMLDKQMPVMDGLQTCKQLRQLGYTGTIIGVTGSCMPSEV